MDKLYNFDLELQLLGSPVMLRMGQTDYISRFRWEIYRHSNVDYEFHILLSGCSTMEADGRELSLQAGQAALISPGIFHEPRWQSSDYERFGFSFMPTSAALTKQLFEQLSSVTVLSLSPDTTRLCRTILEEVSVSKPFQTDTLRALFTQLLIYLFRGIGLDSSAPGDSTDHTTAWRRAVIDYFFSPWPNSFRTEEELANRLNLSKRQLNRILIQQYGMGFRQKMLQVRMEYAGYLLRTTDQKAGQIGALVGYTVESSFYKAFQSYFQMTPQQYREQ